MIRARNFLWLKSMLVLLLLAALAPVQAQVQRDPSQNHIKAQLEVAGPPQPGETVEVAFRFRPDEPWHGYWANPGDAGYGMTLDWHLPEGWTAGEPEYPVPQRLVIAGLMNHVYEGEYAVVVPISVPADAAVTNPAPLSVDAQWLACTDKICVPERATLTAVWPAAPVDATTAEFDQWRAKLPPLLDQHASYELASGKLRVAVPLPASMELPAPHLFVENDQLVRYADPQAFYRDGDALIAEIPLQDNASADGAIRGLLALDDAGNGVTFIAEVGNVPSGGTPVGGTAAAVTAPLWALLSGALLGGLLLNIMPCVFPILSLKALSLARAGESEAQARREGLAYTAGVVLAVLALGVLMLALRAAGTEIGWAFQLQEPGVIVVLLALAVAITANLAGLFELPSISVTRSGEPAGAFATGLLAAFVATPCTGPFMAAAMGAALLLPAPQALLLFAALGLGLALPFLLLGWVPALRKLLPRPGAWMNTFRKIMAVPMALTAAALLWLAWRIGGTNFAIVATLAIFGLLVALWAAGRRQRGGRAAGASFALVAAPFAAFAAIALPMTIETRGPANPDESLLAPIAYSEGALAEARAAGQPVFVWFTADWCLTCKVNEGVAIEREETKAAFQKAGVVAMVGDWTRRDPEITRFLTAHGAAGVPLYMWYPAGGDGEQLPQVLTPSSLVELAEGASS